MLEYNYPLYHLEINQHNNLVTDIIEYWKNEAVDETVIAMILKDIAGVVHPLNAPIEKKIELSRKYFIEILFNCKKHNFHRGFYAIHNQIVNICTLIFLLKECNISILDNQFHDHFANLRSLNNTANQHSAFISYKIAANLADNSGLNEGNCLKLIAFAINIVHYYQAKLGHDKALFLARNIINSTVDSSNSADVDKTLLKNLFTATLIVYYDG